MWLYGGTQRPPPQKLTPLFPQKNTPLFPREFVGKEWSLWGKSGVSFWGKSGVSLWGKSGVSLWGKSGVCGERVEWVCGERVEWVYGEVAAVYHHTIVTISCYLKTLASKCDNKQNTQREHNTLHITGEQTQSNWSKLMQKCEEQYNG